MRSGLVITYPHSWGIRFVFDLTSDVLSFLLSSFFFGHGHGIMRGGKYGRPNQSKLNNFCAVDCEPMKYALIGCRGNI